MLKRATIFVTLAAGIATVVQLIVSLAADPPKPAAAGDAANNVWARLAAVFLSGDVPEGFEAIPSELTPEAVAALAEGCNIGHDQPFVIDWDATRLSSFEALASADVVMVAYDGCQLRIIDRCRNDIVPGSFGTYRAPVWTTGSLESLDIHNQRELVTKLPLGRASLGDRVAAGEQFHMEYFVSGTSYATRSDIYRDDLARVPACAEASHFVYAYNLGAFALGSSKGLDGKAGTSVFGYGTEGTRSSSRKADKRGGDLSACTAENTDANRNCRIPIRLNLRPISAGSNPNAAAMTGPVDERALNYVGEIDAKIDANAAIQRHISAAQTYLQARDGGGCLTELDAQDRVNPAMLSTDAASPLSGMRHQCLMLAGKCDAGKALAVEYYSRFLPSEHISTTMDEIVAQLCQGEMSPRDHVIQAQWRLRNGTYAAHSDAQMCRDEWARIKLHADQAKPLNPRDVGVIELQAAVRRLVPGCLVSAGDCEGAFAAWLEVEPPKDGTEAQRRADFEAWHTDCASP